MVEITVSHEHLLLEVEGMHKLWALKSRLDIPLRTLKAYMPIRIRQWAGFKA